MSQPFTMPMPPAETSADLPYYQAFIQALNDIMPEASILERLQPAMFLTADRTGTSPAHIARLLVEYGLRAPPEAFPECFVEYIKATAKPHPRQIRVLHYPNVSALKGFWKGLPSEQLRTACS